MLLVAGALLCCHHIDCNELVKQIERVDLRIGVVDQHVHEVGQRDIHSFDQILRLEKFTVFVQIVEYQSRNRLPSIVVLGERVIHQVAQEDKSLQVCPLADIVELISAVLNIT